MNLRRLMLGGLSHGVALLAGCGLLRALVPKGDVGPGMTVLEADLRKVSQRPGAGSISATGEASDSAPASKADEWRAKDEFVAAVLRALETLGDPGDLTAALEAEVAKIGAQAVRTSPRCVALVYLQLRKDPSGFVAWWHLLEERGDPGSELQWALRDTFGPAVAVMQARQGEEAVVEIARSAPEFFKNEMLCSWVDLLLRRPDLAQLTGLTRKLDPEMSRIFTGCLGSAWPVEARELKVRWAAEQGNAQILAEGLMDGPEGGLWLRSVLEDPTLPDAFRAELGQNRDVAYVISRDPQVPLDIRIAAFKRAAEGEDRWTGTRSDEEWVAWRDIRREVLRVDWPYLLARGEVTAAEVAAMVEKSTPLLAEAAPGLLRRQLFGELAEADPARAAELLDPALPAEERMAWYTDAVRRVEEPVSQAVFQEILRQLPAADSPELRAGRNLILHRQAGMGLEQQGESYLSTVEALPAGPDRDVLLAKLAWLLSQQSPQESERLRAEIGDARLRTKTPTYPDEWEVGP